VIRLNSNSLQKAFDEEVEPKDLISDLESELYSITAISHKKEPKSITAGIRESIINMEAYKKGQIVGTPSGLKDMDNLTGGWQKQDLIILAGRPSQGKTQVGIKFIYEACLAGKSCLFFSLEMSMAQISTRLILMETGMGSDDIRRGLTDGEWMMVDAAIHNIEKLKLFIDDTAALPIMECISKIRRAKMRHGVDLVVIDYLQLMKGIKTRGDYNRDLEIGSITSALKSVAKELDIPIILLSQLNRSVEMRASKRPQLSDLRESGNIEQDADLVVFIYRGEVYHKPDADIGVEPNVGELIVEKHRNGKTGTIFFRKNDNFSQIYNY
jgi:replicative DNA helicase